jgi:hypothetical protein
MNSDEALATMAQSLLTLGTQMGSLTELVADLQRRMEKQQTVKEWYTTSELAQALGRSHYTVQERWCNEGRIACEKDPDSGKWRIPGEEYQRLVGGGGLRAKKH